MHGIVIGCCIPVLHSDWLIVHHHRQPVAENTDVSQLCVCCDTDHLAIIKPIKVQIAVTNSSKHLNWVLKHESFVKNIT